MPDQLFRSAQVVRFYSEIIRGLGSHKLHLINYQDEAAEDQMFLDSGTFSKVPVASHNASSYRIVIIIGISFSHQAECRNFCAFPPAQTSDPCADYELRVLICGSPGLSRGRISASILLCFDSFAIEPVFSRVVGDAPSTFLAPL